MAADQDYDAVGAFANSPSTFEAQDNNPASQTQQLNPAVRHLARHSLRSEDSYEASRDVIRSKEKPRPFYNSSQWSADGTSIIVGASDQTVSSFVLPSDLLQATSGKDGRPLQPQAVVQLPEPTQVIAAAPYFSLADPATQTFLVGCRDHPLQLYHAFPDDNHAAPLCSYKLIRHENEQYITPSSLIWQHPGTHFICGSANRIDCFDASRSGSDGLVQTIPTIPSRRHISKGSGVGMKGTVSALAANTGDSGDASIVAAGTWTRWMGLYDLYRTDKVAANWSIAGADEANFRIDLGGQGIVQTLWSPCGRYLVVNERHSAGLLVYDIRGTGQLLSILHGRKSSTQQKLTCDIFQGSDGYGFELWAGSEDGSVCVWEGVGLQNDVLEPNWSWGAHQSPVGSTILHASGSVAATCGGGWEHIRDYDVAESLGVGHKLTPQSRVHSESALKIWSIGGQGVSQQESGDE